MTSHSLLTQDIQAFQKNALHTQTIISYIDDIFTYGDNLEEQTRVKIELMKFFTLKRWMINLGKVQGPPNYPKLSRHNLVLWR